MKKILAIAFVALLVSSCTKDETVIVPSAFNLELTVDNQSSFPATFSVGYGLDSANQQYMSTMLPDVTFPIGKSTQTFVADCKYSNIYFCLLLVDRTKQNVVIDNFYGYGLTYTMTTKNDNTSMLIVNK